MMNIIFETLIELGMHLALVIFLFGSMILASSKTHGVSVKEELFGEDE